MFFNSHMYDNNICTPKFTYSFPTLGVLLLSLKKKQQKKTCGITRNISVQVALFSLKYFPGHMLLKVG